MDAILFGGVSLTREQRCYSRKNLVKRRPPDTCMGLTIIRKGFSDGPGDLVLHRNQSRRAVALAAHPGVSVGAAGARALLIRKSGGEKGGVIFRCGGSRRSDGCVRLHPHKGLLRSARQSLDRKTSSGATWRRRSLCNPSCR